MTNYNNFANTFSNSRETMKWEEINYFLNFLKWKNNLKILDIWCWNWRLLWEIIKNKINFWTYLWVDLSDWLLLEAKKKYKDYNFLNIDMLNLDKIKKKYDFIFFIASFHHLKNLEERLKVLQKTSKLLNKNGKIFMTNWALNSNFNKKKYWKSKINWTKNKFWNNDYSIKIGKFFRFYHCFSIEELEFLFKKNWFKIKENKLFKNEKNFITIVEI